MMSKICEWRARLFAEANSRSGVIYIGVDLVSLDSVIESKR